MKLTELYNVDTIEWDDDKCTLTIGDVDVELSMPLEEGMRRFGMTTSPRKSTSVAKRAVKGAKQFFSNPFVAGLTALVATNAVQKYNQNKRYTTKFFAKSAEEKKLYDNIIRDLMATGKYKLVKTQFVDGGKLWVLKRNN